MSRDSSTKALKVGIATEGPASKEVLEAICKRNGVVYRVLSTEGKEKLFKDFHKLLFGLRHTFEANLFIIVPDLHPQVDCVSDAQRWKTEIAKRFPEAQLCLAIWETESWLLADTVALREYLGIDGDVPAPDQTGGTPPSQWLHDAFRRARGYKRGMAFDKRTDGVELAKRIDLELTAGRSPSFRRFLSMLH